MKILIIDQCSKAKKNPDVPVDDSLSHHETVERDDLPKYKARDLYEGRQQEFVSDAVDIFRDNGDEVDRVFISAGYGVVEETEKLLPYDKTFSGLSNGEIRERSSQLKIQEDILELLNREYDLIFFALGNKYYQAIDIDTVLTEVSDKTIVVTFNRDITSNEDINHISIPARTKQAKEQGAIVVALKGKYLKNLAEHRKRGMNIQSKEDVFRYCTTEPSTQSDLEEY